MEAFYTAFGPLAEYPLFQAPNITVQLAHGMILNGKIAFLNFLWPLSTSLKRRETKNASPLPSFH